MIRRPTLAVAVAAALLAGCGADIPPRVGFSAGGQTVRIGPAQYCDLGLTECAGDPAARVELAVPPGTPVRVEVPGELAGTPWTVVFRYRTGAGEQVDGRSPLFAPGEREEYLLELPDPTDRLLTAQVQQLGASPTIDETTGEVLFPARATWVLTTTARP